MATAEFIVDQFNASTHGFHGMTLGDRDMLLGLKTLKRLEKRAKFPILATNLVDKASGKPLFETTTVHSVKGADGQSVKVGLLGLLSATARLPQDMPAKVAPVNEAAKAAVASLRAQGASVILVLSHLADAEQQSLAKDVPGITAILGGATVKMVRHAVAAGNTFITNAHSKGKHLAVLRLNVHKRSGADGVSGQFVDRFRGGSLRDKIASLDGRIARYEQIVEKQKTQAAGNKQASSRASFYQKQLTKMRTDKKLAEMELAGAANDVDPKADFIQFELIALSKHIKHEPGIDRAIETLRKKVAKLDMASRRKGQRAVAPMRGLKPIKGTDKRIQGLPQGVIPRGPSQNQGPRKRP